MNSERPTYYLGIDVGSSSVKAVAVAADDSSVSAIGRAGFSVTRPTAGGWEVDPTDLFGAVVSAVHDLPAEVRDATTGLGVAGQMCGLVALDAARRTVGPILPIFDDRSLAESREIGAQYGERLRARSGNDALPVYTLPKLLWMKHHRAEDYANTDLVVLPKDYVRGRLTGKWATDPSDASGTLAFDQKAGEWDNQLLDGLGLRRDQWPPISPSGAAAGRLTAHAAAALELPRDITVAVGCSDMAAVILGVGASTTEDLIVSFGTAAHVISPVDTLRSDVWPIQQYTSAGGNWFRFGAVYSGAACADWLLGVLQREDEYSLFDNVPDRPVDERPLFMPYLAGAGAPHEVPEAAGAFIGLRLGHTPEDLARAVLEGLCFEVAEICDAHDPERRRTIYVTGGGSQLGEIVQFLADVLGRELLLSHSPEAAGVGAARLAAMAAGAEGATPPPPAGTIAPRLSSDGASAALRRRYRAAATAVRNLAVEAPDERS